MSATLDRALAPPHNLDAEQSVLGGIFLSDRHLYALVIEEGLKPEDFYREQHGLVYQAILDLYDEGLEIDHLTVTEHLREHGKLDAAGGEASVGALAAAPPASGHVQGYAQIVRRNSLLRRLLNETYEIQASVMNRDGDPDALVDRAQRAILEVNHDDRQKDFVPAQEMLDRALDQFHRLSTQKTTLIGTPSGFKDIDAITGGFVPGNLIIIAARPSMGKSALVTNIAENAALTPGAKPIALFSLEMSENELAQRFVASQASISGDELRRGRIEERRWPKVLEKSQKLAASPLFIDDSADLGTTEIRAKARRLHQQSEDGLGLVIIDYLQLLRADGRVENRVQQIGEMSRGLKMLARELDVPVIALSQLSRAPEQRTDKRPMLSDLRECVTGDTLVLLADGRRVPIRELAGETPDVLAVGADGRLLEARSDRVWRVGRRTVHEVRLASGRRVRATSDHRLRGADGWRTVGSLAPGDRLALARRTPEPARAVAWPDDHVVLLGQLVGDGSYLSGQPMRYTTASEANSAAVRASAERAFGATVTRHPGQGTWHQLVISGNGNRWHPAGVGRWLKELGIFGQRSHQKRLPVEAHTLPRRQIALLLRHLWATDGCTWMGTSAAGKAIRRVSYATNSPGLAADVAALLLRLGIVARISVTPEGGHRPRHDVIVSGRAFQRRFLEEVGGFGPREAGVAALLADLPAAGYTNVDTLPLETWDVVRAAMTERGVTQRAMASLRGTSYGGTSHYRFAPSRVTAAEYAALLDLPKLRAAAEDDLFWDAVVSVEPAGEEDVYDLTVPGPASWLADGVVSHNSGNIEQDADVVMFIYRDEYYNPEDTESPGVAEIIISKHRNGGLANIKLAFQHKYPRFLNYVDEERYG